MLLNPHHLVDRINVILGHVDHIAFRFLLARLRHVTVVPVRTYAKLSLAGLVGKGKAKAMAVGHMANSAEA